VSSFALSPDDRVHSTLRESFMRFAICQELFVDWDWSRQCEFIARTGYTGIEVAPFTLARRISEVSDETLQSMRAEADRHGLSIVGLHWLLAKTEGLHLTTRNADVRRATAAYFVELGRACRQLGGDVMVLGSPQQRNLETGVTTAEAMDNAVDVFRQCLPQLEELGVRICMEPLTPKETDFCNTCAEAVELMDRLQSPSFVLHQDVKAMLGAETDTVPELIHRYKNHVGHFHVNDTNLLGPGMGETDYGPILQALTETGYAGWVSVEVFDYSPGAEKIATDSLRYMQSILEQIQS
jgi:sugar phosphate isomerase/epimerase